jgi:antitoxin component of MazEF toxin-antitoxin module
MSGELDLEHEVIVLATRDVHPRSGDFTRVALKLLHAKISDGVEARLSNEGRPDARIEPVPREVWYDLLAPVGHPVARMNAGRRVKKRHGSS